MARNNVVPFPVPVDDFDTEGAPDTHEYGSRWVPGLTTPPEVALKPYPVNIYQEEGDSGSGIAGTLYPDGRFAPLENVVVPDTCRYWVFMDLDEQGKRQNGFRTAPVIWNGAVSQQLSHAQFEDGTPYKVRLETATLLGEWPFQQKYHGPVNPVKARLAAELDAIEDARMAKFQQEAA